MAEKVSKQPKYDFFKRIYFAIYNHFVNSNPDKDGFGINMLKCTLAIPFCIPTNLRLCSYNKEPDKEKLDYAFVFFNPFKESNYYIFIVDMGLVIEHTDGRINVLFYEENNLGPHTYPELIEETEKLISTMGSSIDEFSINVKKLFSLQTQVNKIKAQNGIFERDQYLKELALENLRQVCEYHHFIDGFKNIQYIYNNYLNKRIKSLLKNKVIKNSREVLKEMLEIENCDPYLTASLSVKNLTKYGILDQFFYNDKMAINSLQLELDIPDFEDDIYLVEISENGFDENRLAELNDEYSSLTSEIKNKTLAHGLAYQGLNKFGSLYRFKKTNITPANTFFIPFPNPSTDRVIFGYSLDENFVKEVFPSRDCSVGAAMLQVHWHKQEVSYNLFQTDALFCPEPSEHFSADVGFYPVIGLGFAQKFQNLIQEKFDASLKRFIERYKPEKFMSEEDFLNEMREIYKLLNSRNELKIKSDNEQLEYFRELSHLVFANNEVI